MQELQKPYVIGFCNSFLHRVVAAMKKEGQCKKEKPSISGQELIDLANACQLDGRRISRVDVIGTSRYRVTIQERPTPIPETPDLFQNMTASRFLTPKPSHDTNP
jgi:hypothetical protein